MAATRVFISYDYDHDSFLKEALVGQSKHSDSPFDISDWSIKVASPGWRAEAQRRISASTTVAVICGKHTHTATGVAAEVSIAQSLHKPYFLLAGYSEGRNTKPTTALAGDQMYKWTWENLKTLVLGGR
jgi:hypothetical protein